MLFPEEHWHRFTGTESFLKSLGFLLIRLISSVHARPRRLSITDLSPEAHQLLEVVRKGEPVLVESEGTDEAILVDLTDYRLLRAAMNAVSERTPPGEGLSEDALPSNVDIQTRYDQVVLNYLAGLISLSRAAELLDCSPVGLRARFERLGLPQRPAPETPDEAHSDVKTVLHWADSDDA